MRFVLLRLTMKSLIVLIIIAFPVYATSGSLTCSGDITTNVQAAIDASVDGDVVSISSGTCSTSSPVSWQDKNITIKGAGKDITNISMPAGGFFIMIKNPTKASVRITGMTIYGTTASNRIITLDSEYCTSASSGWRIDHIKFNYSGAVANDPIVIYGVTFGLFDHNDFSFGNATWILVAFFQTGLGETASDVTTAVGWYNLSLPSQYGTANAIYFEDNTFTATTDYNAFFDTSAGGARVVFRHNVFSGGFVYAHWTRSGELIAFQWELYNNTFIANSHWVNAPVRFESGTGVIYNNTFSGPYTETGFFVDDRRGCGQDSGGFFGVCDGSQPWDGNAGDPATPGWPCLAQIGRGFGKTYSQITSGDTLPSLPAYAWNNGGQDKCADTNAAGASCTDTFHLADYWKCAYVSSTPHSNGEVDFVNSGTTPMPGYTPYTYPHPLQSGKQVTPLPPTTLKVLIN
jgi:hypothetical protein